MLTPKRVALKKSKRKSLDIDFSIPQLNPNIAFTRSTTATVLAYAPTAVAGDLPLVTTCAINEARFQNARRVSQGVWSNTLNDGSDISLPISLLHEEARSNLCLQSEVFKTTWVDALATGLSPNSITISPDGNFAYVTNANSSTASQYSRDAATGLLSALSPATIATGTTPWSITISPDGNFAYVTNANSSTASQYSRNAATGLLTLNNPIVITDNSTTAPDGATTADTLTAAAANSTLLQTITSAIAPRAFSIWLKRLTGTGNIDLTVDGGTTWTTVAVTSTWTRFILTRENVTNPGVGIRIVTKDDAVYAWGAQLESKNNASSYIPTTTAAITKTTDSALFTGTNLSSWYNTLQGTFIVTANGQEFVAPYNMGVTALTYASQTKYGLSYDNDNKMGSTYLYTAGTVVAPTEYTSIAVPSSLYIAGGGLTNVTRFTYYQTKLKTAQMELLL